MQFDGIVFPGQGIQFQGMGKDFVESYPEAKHIFQEASDTLNFNVYDLCQNDRESLNNTEYTQPSILTLEIAIYKVLQQQYNISPVFFAGHSLGEYTALVAAQTIPFDIALKLVRFRGKLMQQAMNNNSGGMVALIMEEIPFEQINKIASNFNVDIANDNSNQQIVLSGYMADLKETVTKIEETLVNKPIRVVYLTVSAPFHSRYMQHIEPTFNNYLNSFREQFNPTNLTSVISNYSGGFYTTNSIELLINNLTKQISGEVKWRQNMQNLIKKTKNILEIGPTTPLKSFFKSIGVSIQSINSVKSLNKLFNL